MRTMRIFVIVVLAVAGAAWWRLAHRANRTSAADARPRVPVATVPVVYAIVEQHGEARRTATPATPGA